MQSPTILPAQTAVRLIATVRQIESEPDLVRVIELRREGIAEPIARGAEAVLGALARALAEGTRVELLPHVETVSPSSREGEGLRASVLLAGSPSASRQGLLLATPQDFHLLGLRLERPSQPRAPDACAALLGVNASELRGGTPDGVWRWYPSDRTVRWAPTEGAPWALRWKATRSACLTPGELWETLAARGVIPDDWVESVARDFYDAPRRGDKSVASGVPVNFASALLLGADIEGARHAEVLMQEALSALRPWGVSACARVRWCPPGAAPSRYAEPEAPPLPSVLTDLIERTEAGVTHRKPFLTALERAADARLNRVHVALPLAEAHLAWRTWCAEDRIVPSRIEEWPKTEETPRWRTVTSWGSPRWRAPQELVGKRFRDLSDPTRPLLAILALGYTPGFATGECVLLHYRLR